MSSFDVTRISNTLPLRETGANVPARTRSGQGNAPSGGAPQPGVSVETGNAVSAGDAPVDNGRVAEIRAALQQGQYPLNPAKITDAIIAARLMLSVGE
ncbi:MAG: flagellar biosynthesis anti-sigma factor FlgM [Alteripontixanthobacter sp.]